MTLKTITFLLLFALAGLLFYVDYRALSESFDPVLLARALWPSLLIILAVTVLFEFVLRKESRQHVGVINRELCALPDRIYKAFSAQLSSPDNLRFAVTANFAATIGGEEKAAIFFSMLSTIVSDVNFVDDLEVEIILHPIAGEGRYILDCRETFTARRDFIHVASSSDQLTVSRLTNQSNSLDKIYALPSQESPQKATRGLNIEVLVRDDSGTPPRWIATEPPIELSVGQKMSLLQGSELTSAEVATLSVYKYKFLSNNNSRKIRLSCQMDMDTTRGFCYWSTDRLSFVRSVKIDYSRMFAEIDDIQIIDFFFNPSIRFEHDLEQRRMQLLYNAWALPGNGVSLQWRAN